LRVFQKSGSFLGKKAFRGGNHSSPRMGIGKPRGVGSFFHFNSKGEGWGNRKKDVRQKKKGPVIWGVGSPTVRVRKGVGTKTIGRGWETRLFTLTLNYWTNAGKSYGKEKP